MEKKKRFKNGHFNPKKIMTKVIQFKLFLYWLYYCIFCFDYSKNKLRNSRKKNLIKLGFFSKKGDQKTLFKSQINHTLSPKNRCIIKTFTSKNFNLKKASLSNSTKYRCAHYFFNKKKTNIYAINIYGQFSLINDWLLISSDETRCY